MPGNYQCTQSAAAPIAATLLAPMYSANPGAPTQGAPIGLDLAGFVRVPMYNPELEEDGWNGGQIGPQSPAGYYTDSVTDCIVIAAMQRTPAGVWRRCFFAHTTGGSWPPLLALAFQVCITNPADAWLALYCPRSSTQTLRTFLTIIDPGGQIPANQVLCYQGSDDGAGSQFGLRLADGAVGQYAPNIAPPGVPLLGMQIVTADFGPTTTSSVTQQVALAPPPHAATAIPVLTGYQAEYTGNNQYGMGELQINLVPISTQSLQVEATLRDNNINERQWQGSVTAQVFYFGHPAS